MARERRRCSLFVLIVVFALGVAAGMAIGSWEEVKEASSQATEELKGTTLDADKAAEELRAGAEKTWEVVKEGSKEAAATSASLWQRIKRAWRELND